MLEQWPWSITRSGSTYLTDHSIIGSPRSDHDRAYPPFYDRAWSCPSLVPSRCSFVDAENSRFRVVIFTGLVRSAPWSRLQDCASSCRTAGWDVPCRLSHQQIGWQGGLGRAGGRQSMVGPLLRSGPLLWGWHYHGDCTVAASVPKRPVRPFFP